MAQLAELRALYETLEPAAPAGDPGSIEAALGVSLPEDVRQIMSFYSGGLLGGISHLDWSTDGSHNVVSATCRVQANRGVPRTFVLLAEPPESVVVLLPARTPAVIWCSTHDFDRVVRGEAPSSHVDEFVTYADFVGFLLRQELEERELGPAPTPVPRSSA